MQSHSPSLDTLKDNLLRAVDAEYNVIKPGIVVDVIHQLETMAISKDQLQATRLGREINNIRQKIDARKKNAQFTGKCPESMIEIAHRAKKLLRSWQGLLNTSPVDSPPPTNPDTKPRLILKVKLNSPLTKRKRESTVTNAKRKKTQMIETSSSLPRLKTTQELLLEMQMNEPNVLATQTSTVNAILQKTIIDESLHETVKLDYSALHHGRDLHHTNPNSTQHPKQSSFVLTLSNTNWETGSNAGSPLSPLSSSSSTTSRTSWSISEQSTCNSSDPATTCASFQTVADLVEDHRRRISAAHDSREIEARPDLLLVPIDKLAFVYEREKIRQLDPPSSFRPSSLTTVERLNQSSDLFALPFVDCPMEFDLVLDELVVQHPTMDM